MTPMLDMSKDVCLAISQIMPVLLVVLIAEQVTVRVRRDGRIPPRDLLAALARVLVDFVLAIALIVEVWLVLRGVQSDGLEGEAAQIAWNLAIFMLVAVVYRWFLLTPIVRYAIGQTFDAYARFINAWLRVLDGMTGVVAASIDLTVRVLSLPFEFALHVLTGGIQTFSDGISQLVLRRRRKKTDDDDKD